MKKRNYFPMFFDISQKRILVVGGGTIATRRIKTLLKFTDHLTVIAPDFSEELQQLKENKEFNGLVFLHQPFTEETEKMLDQMDLVFTATDCTELNQRIVALCHEKHVLVNTADDKNACDFFFPSVIEKEGIVIGMNSGGENPGKVKRLREALEQMLCNFRI